MKKNKTFFFKIFSIQLVAMFFVITISVLLSLRAVSEIIYNKTTKELEQICRLVSNLLPNEGIESLFDIEAMSLYATAGTDIRLTVIQYSGSVLADSQANYRNMKNHFDRPEVREALGQAIGHSIRMSETMGIEMVYAAVSIPDKSYIIRTSTPVTEVHSFFRIMYAKLIPYSIIIFLCMLIFVYIFTSSINTTLKSIKDVTKLYASGDFSIKLPPRDDDLGELSEALNSMGDQLGNRIDMITAQRDQIQAIVSGMINPVIVLDEKLTITDMNPAAIHLTGVSENYIGTSINDAVPNKEFTNLIQESLIQKTSREGAICLNSENKTYYFVYTSYIGGTVLVVMNDISGLKRLDEIRQEFSSNVSHELKTPVTSIMGYVDTLLDIYKDHPENIGQFLEIIKKQSIRLAGIIEDLLTLSRADSSYIRLEKERIPANNIITMCIANNGSLAEAKNIKLSADIQKDAIILAHPVLAQQAVGNLINNAIKYSGPGSEVKISVTTDSQYTVVSVADNGPGIAEENQKKIFERFFRISKEVSRNLGGTGLGLAIVKQVAITHGGKVELESTVGKGSTFKIYFPI